MLSIQRFFPFLHDVASERVLIKDPEGETVVNETEEIVPGEEFNKTYDSLEPFKNYTTEITPVVDGKDEEPEKNDFTTGSNRFPFPSLDTESHAAVRC